MSTPTGAPLVRRFLLALLCLGGIHYLSPLPGPQAVLNSFLVLGLAPGFELPWPGWPGPPRAAGCWKAPCGSTRTWAAPPSATCWPACSRSACCCAGRPMPSSRYWGRQAVLVIIHTLLVHFSVRFAAGPSAWGDRLALVARS